MSSPVNACRLTDDINECARMLTEANTRHLAVVEDGALVGLISLRDVQAALARMPWKRPLDDPANMMIPVFHEG